MCLYMDIYFLKIIYSFVYSEIETGKILDMFISYYIILFFRYTCHLNGWIKSIVLLSFRKKVNNHTES